LTLRPAREFEADLLALLEGAEACYALASGMASVFGALACQLKAGDHLVASKALFGSCYQIVTSILKVMPLIAAMVIALIVFGGGGQPAEFAPTPVTPNGVAAAATLTLWAMLGFECASVPAGRVQDPERTIPRATLIGTLAVGLIYLAASSSVFLLLPADVAAKSPAPFADLVRHFWGSGAATLVVFFAAISCLGALNGWVLLQGEVPLALARRGVFPKWFGKVNSRGMPVQAQLTGSALARWRTLCGPARGTRARRMGGAL